MKILSQPGEFIWKVSHGNWTSFLLGWNVSQLIQVACRAKKASQNSCLLCLKTTLTRAARVNQNSKGEGHKTKTMRLNVLKLSREQKESAELGNHSLYVRHFEWPLSHCTWPTALTALKIWTFTARRFPGVLRKDCFHKTYSITYNTKVWKQSNS